MPQVRKDPPSQRIQDKESKRARGALSCAECRRLKLKCDKTVPCSSCKRRGCSAICPNGSLITGQGTRFVLADTEKLHQKIAKMSDRIRLLEDALAILQSTVTGPGGEPHPLLHRDLLAIKSSIELHSATQGGSPGEDGADADEYGEGDEEQYIDAFGTLAIHDDGAATFYGRSAGSESLLIGEAAASALSPLYSNLHSSPQSSSQNYHHRQSYPDLQPNSSQYYSQQQSNSVHARYQLHSSNGAPLPSSVSSLAASFPLALSLPPPESSSMSTHFKTQPITLHTLITYYLPIYSEALRLVQIYLEQAPWFFGAVTKRQIEEEMLPLWYEEAAVSSPPQQQQVPSGPGTQTRINNSPSSNTSSPSSTNVASTPGQTQSQLKHSQPRVGNSHDLALLFMIFCFGSLTDTNLPSPPDNIPAERFYQLTKVSLSLDPHAGPDSISSRSGIFERPPSVATVQALSLMAIYEGICSGENSIESTWALMGLACKLAQSVGLHRDCARWKLTPAEVQKRRALFWELFITDCWQGLATGRLSTFSLPFVDCELPFDTDKTLADDGTPQPSFPYWKARFGAECVSAVVQGTLTSRAPKYSIILDLDRKVRDMELPLYAQGQPPQGKGLAETMSHFMPLNYRELTLLYIHRCFFAHAISSNPLDPIKSQYAPSFLAGYRSACNIVASVKLQFKLFPAQIARFWVLWTHAFSASVMLASVATHASRSKIAPAALLELKNACDLFNDASGYGGRAIKFLPILKRLQTKAQQAYRDANNGLPPNIPNDIFKPSNPDVEIKDELSIFSGKTHTLTAKSTSTSTAPTGTASAGNTPPNLNKLRSSSDSPQLVLTDHPSFEGVHPSLVSELNVFNGLIKSQTENAYKAGGEVFGGGPMIVDGESKEQGSSGHHQSTQMHVVRQQQQQQQQAMYQPDYQRQHLDRQEAERLEWEREEAANREMKRQEMERERQELARQQQLHQQREIQRQQAHEQEIQRQQQQQAQEEMIQQQQSDIRRQQEKQQQHMQDQYRQQLEIQQHRQRQQQQQAVPQYRQQHHSYDHDRQHQSQMLVEPDHEMVVSSTSPSHATPPIPKYVSHSQSQPNIHQAYQQHQQPHYQPMHHPDPAGLPPSHAPPPPIQRASQRTQQHIRHSPLSQQQQQQHSMYAVPPEYPQYPGGDSIRSSTSSVNYAPPTSVYVPPTPISATSSSSSYISYWPAASNSFAMPDQQPTSAPGPNGAGYGTSATVPRMQIPEHQHYTPEGALRGIAADDRSLQETWQSYMNKVGSPRQFFDD